MRNPCHTAKNSGVGRENFRPVCQVFPSCLKGKTTQEHLFTSHRSACEVWVDSDILENFSQNGGYVVLARSHSIMQAIILSLGEHLSNCMMCTQCTGMIPCG